MNDETIELLLPYLELRMSGGAAAKEKDAAEDGTLPAFHPKFAGGACSQAVTLMQYAEAMKGYHEASKVVKPKLEALKLAEARLAEAQRKQKVAETQLAECEATLQELEDDLGRTMSEKKALEDQARATERTMTRAGELIGGLGGEQRRWTEDARKFGEAKHKLVGDCAVACAFVSYCGPFNQSYRERCVQRLFLGDAIQRGVPVSAELGGELVDFLVDRSLLASWQLEGLPTDGLSSQNGILVSKAQATRFPCLVDPQGQAMTWLLRHEADRLPNVEKLLQGTTTVSGHAAAAVAAATTAIIAAPTARPSHTGRIPLCIVPPSVHCALPLSPLCRIASVTAAPTRRRTPSSRSSCSTAWRTARR